MTAPGVPMIFQGQEFLEDEYFQDTDALDWSKKETYRGVFELHRDLITLDGQATVFEGDNITEAAKRSDVRDGAAKGEGGLVIRIVNA